MSENARFFVDGTLVPSLMIVNVSIRSPRAIIKAVNGGVVGEDVSNLAEASNVNIRTRIAVLSDVFNGWRGDGGVTLRVERTNESPQLFQRMRLTGR